jgi:hypothetical protein
MTRYVETTPLLRVSVEFGSSSVSIGMHLSIVKAMAGGVNLTSRMRAPQMRGQSFPYEV